MIIIWRRWGWLILVFFLLAWWLSDSVVQPIYRGATGFEFMYNAEKGISWAIALFVVAALIFVFWYFLLRREGQPLTEAEWAKVKENAANSIRASESLRIEGDLTTEQKLAQLEASQPPPPTKKSSFFFIPFRFFPFIFAAIAILLLVINIPVALAEAVGR